MSLLLRLLLLERVELGLGGVQELQVEQRVRLQVVTAFLDCKNRKERSISGQMIGFAKDRRVGEGM